MITLLTLPQFPPVTLRWVFPLLILAISMVCPTPSAAQARDAESIARMAMSTASLWMMEHHEHEIGEALEEGDLEEALEEAEELVVWMNGAPWLSEISAPAQAATDAAREVEQKLSAGDKAGARSAFEVMQKKFRHLHHELMEVVGGSGKSL
jgi:hypothetical protein